MRFFLASFFPFAIAQITGPIKLPGTWPARDTPTPPVPEWSSWASARSKNVSALFDNCPNRSDWAVTIDDGPSGDTARVLDALKAANVKATFFVLGSRVIEWPELVKRAYDEGHQIGLHGWSHEDLLKLSPDQIAAEFLWTAKAVYSVIGKVPRYMRPPYGDYDQNSLKVLGAIDLKVALWNADDMSWHFDEPGFVWNQTVPGNVSEFLKDPTIKTGLLSLHHDKAAPEADGVIYTLNQNAPQFTKRRVGECRGDTSDWYFEGFPFPDFDNGAPNGTFTVSSNGTGINSSTAPTTSSSAVDPTSGINGNTAGASKNSAMKAIPSGFAFALMSVLLV